MLGMVFWAAGISHGQPVKAAAILDSTRLLIGDQATLTLELEKPASLEAEWAIIRDTLAGNIEVLRRFPVDTLQLDAQQVKMVQKLLVTCFDSGQYRIPPFAFGLKREGITDTVFTNELYMQVLTLEIDTTRGPADIKMPYDAPVTLKEATPYLLGSILLGALIFLLVYSLQRRKKKLPLFARMPKPREPAHVVALRELDRIREEKMWQKDRIKEFYTDITGVLRTYIEERFGIPAMEQTTEEIITTFLSNRELIREKSLDHLSQMLPLADLVKFARYLPMPEDHNLVLMNAYFFVNETKAEESRTPAAPAGQAPGEEGEEVILK